MTGSEAGGEPSNPLGEELVLKTDADFGQAFLFSQNIACLSASIDRRTVEGPFPRSRTTYSKPFDFERHAELKPWAPTVDGKILPESPFSNRAPAASAKVPLLVGSTRTEMGWAGVGSTSKTLLPAN